MCPTLRTGSNFHPTRTTFTVNSAPAVILTGAVFCLICILSRLLLKTGQIYTKRAAVSHVALWNGTQQIRNNDGEEEKWNQAVRRESGFLRMRKQIGHNFGNLRLGTKKTGRMIPGVVCHGKCGRCPGISHGPILSPKSRAAQSNLVLI